MKKFQDYTIPYNLEMMLPRNAASKYMYEALCVCVYILWFGKALY